MPCRMRIVGRALRCLPPGVMLGWPHRLLPGKVQAVSVQDLVSVKHYTCQGFNRGTQSRSVFKARWV